MAVYRVQAPDGSILELEGPDNATQEQIMQAAQAAYAQRQAQAAPAAAPAQPYVAPPSTRPAEPARAPTMGERLVGAGEAALATLTGAVGAPVGLAGGALGGLAGAILSGQFGTREAAQEVERAAQEAAARFVYQPRTATGQQYAQAIGETVAEVAPPLLPQIAAPGAAMRAVAQQAPLVEATTRAGMAAAAPAAQAVVQAPSRAVQAAGRAVGIAPPALPPIAPAGAAVQRGAAGAAGVTQAAERAVTAETMPVPFTGETALTAGQRTRDFAQLQFEKESAKLPDVGAPLRERVQRQTANFIQNFDALIDLPQPVARERGDIGRVVTDALVNRAEVKRREIRNAYEQARQAGAMADPVEMAPLAAGLADMASMEGVVPMIGAVRREAIRLGALGTDEAGNLVPRTMSVNDAETLRQFVNNAANWADRRESVFARRINGLIDQATENAGGDLYRRARALRSQFADEFENVGLTARLLGTKGGTNERQIALEDVFTKVIISAPVEEMNKVRGSLLRAGPDGRQAWNDLKSAGIDFIKQRSFSESQRDAAGNPLLSPDKFQRTVGALDRTGKLEALYGKRQAQVLRDLAELSSDIYTAPPGAVNTSNTASALQVALDTVVTFGATSMPVPAVTALREANKYVKNRKTKARIEAALRGQIAE